MKSKILISSFFLLIITLFSFSRKINYQERFKFVILSKEDWKELEKVSYVGKNKVTVVNKNVMVNIVNETQYKSTKEPFNKEQIKKLNEILKKYN